ncbi:MAG: hypothetical protein GWN71_02370, partial [Gammaproteobacteria bacterium]|nr:hypothetical protein [Gemmatimonadota bacterium]NIU72453.1 hypothetical protein [Gammaproteobacteria bacterium]NIY07088.1 hypothetical protein [Gemmatimonadota bacterium]
LRLDRRALGEPRELVPTLEPRSAREVLEDARSTLDRLETALRRLAEPAA